jgi:Meiotically up-regulated gene 113
MIQLNKKPKMEKEFLKYKHDFTKKDSLLLQDNTFFKKEVFQDDNTRIIISADTSIFENHLVIYFLTKVSVEKYAIDFYDDEYHTVLLQLLLKLNFGSSKILQLDIFNKIQQSLSSHFIDEKKYKYFYRETSQNSPFFALTIQLPSLLTFTFCQIDEDKFLKSTQRRIKNLISKDIFKAANTNFVYLQHNRVNNLYKIGFSKTPEFREKTLQSAEPDIVLYRKWICSQKYEKRLKTKFKSKRVRGEWFTLDEKDLLQVDNLMCKFYDSFETVIAGLSTQITNSLAKKQIE